MARYTTRIEADKTKYPVLLSNGNLKEEGQLDGGRHFAVWEVGGVWVRVLLLLLVLPSQQCLCCMVHVAMRMCWVCMQDAR